MRFALPSRSFIAGTMITGGSICALIALFASFACWRFVRTAARVDGRVIAMVEREEQYGKHYAPVFVFRDSNGAEHTVHSSTASYPPQHRVGDAVRILYSPESPQHAKIDSFFWLWGLPFVTGLLAAIYVPLGLLIWHWPAIARRFRLPPPAANMP